MRTLYHLWLCPFSRKVRIALSEKKLNYDLVIEKSWERRKAFLALNPAGDVPVLVEENGHAICDSAAICEYLEEIAPKPSLFEASCCKVEVVYGGNGFLLTSFLSILVI